MSSEKLELYPTDKEQKQNISIYLEGGKTITLEEMEKALYEARNIVLGVGSVGSTDKVIKADKWIQEYFPSYQ